MKIEILRGSLLEVEADAIVNPANSRGYMGGGVAGVIRKIGGDIIEKEAISKAPIPVGSAILTSAGKLPFKGIIHSPTMEEPAMATTSEKVSLATEAALELADSEGLKSVAFPGMGTGVGRLPKDVAADVMLRTIKEFEAKNLEKIILVDLDEDMVNSWKDKFQEVFGR